MFNADPGLPFWGEMNEKGPADQDLKKNALEYFRKAYHLQMGGNLEEAIRTYKQSLNIFPTAEAHTFLGWAYSFFGQYHEAIEECQKAIAIDSDFGNPYNDIGAYLMALGDLDGAIPWFEKAILAKRYDNICFPFLNLGRVWERKGNGFKALEEYKKALEANPYYSVAEKAIKRLVARMN